MFEDSHSFSITIPGKPIPKARPRFCRRGKHVVTFDSQSESNKAARILIREQVSTFIPITTALEVDITFYMAIPKGTSKKKASLMQSGEIKHTKKPDCDNLGKKALDCMNGIVYRDDAQIYKLLCRKQYDTKPRTEITIRW